MNILDAIRTLRKEKGMTFEEARDRAIEFFRAKGWDVPESIAGLYRRPSKR